MLTLDRRREPELMDDPKLDRREHERALRGLARLNACSGTVWALWQPIRRLMRSEGVKHLRILDIATGSADIPVALWELAQRAGYELQIDGCDISDVAVDTANRQATKRGAPLKFFRVDITNDSIPADYDVVMCSLFTHHLSEDQVVQLLSKARDAAQRMVIISDLVRSFPNLVMVSLASQILTRSPVVHFDGIASVKAAFTLDEMKAFAEQAGMKGAVVYEHFPCRMMLVWKKD